MTYKHRQTGFTLIELLIVLVITALTTTLLLTGLNTTWQNFEKLSSRNLLTNQTQLPKSWFIESVRGVLLSHPDTVAFSGTEDVITMTTILPPDQSQSAPKRIQWRIKKSGQRSKFGFEDEDTAFVPLLDVASESRFEYLVGNKWVNSFLPSKGELPTAIRLQNDETLIMAAVVRPLKADMPAEIPAFGKYEF